ncbi:hypothetical protein HYV88_05830 [Candidatus Woesearchaeota archaeon]|nr:hypothetical protein [Candidatus Woesearchaeota archaeon]
MQSFDIKVNVDNIVGIALDNKTLNFGTLPAGNSAFKYIDLINNDDNKKYVYLTSKGRVKNWIVAEKNGFYLGPKTNKTIKVEIFIPKDTKIGEYTGKMKVTFLG